MGGDYQMWIDEPSGQPPGDQGPPPPRSRRWMVVVVGFVVLAAALVVQRSLSGGGADADSVTYVTTATTPSVPPSATGTTSSPPSPRPTSGATSGFGPVNQASGSASPGPSTTRTVNPRGSGGIAVTTSTPLPSAPTVTTATPLSLPGAPFEVVGLAWNASVSSTAVVIRFDSATGRIVRTETPAMMSNGLVSLAATDDAVIVRPWDNVPGYVVRDGKRAEIASGALAQGSLVLPSAQPGSVWVAAIESNGEGKTVLTQVDASGKPTGATITPPGALGTQMSGPWAFTRDGAGGILARGVGGVYQLAPGGPQLVTHGVVLAAGPGAYLVYECDDAARCTTAELDKASGKRTQLSGYTPRAAAMSSQMQGVISPNGRYAAMLNLGPDWPPMSVIDLRSGAVHPINAPITGNYYSDAASLFAFTADSRYLLASAGGGVLMVDPATGDTAKKLPIPGVAAIAIRKAG